MKKNRSAARKRLIKQRNYAKNSASKRDARRLTPDEQALLRNLAVDMVFEEGMTKVQVAQILGVSRPNVVRWCKIYEQYGRDGLKPGVRGRAPGEQSKLQPWQCAQIAKLIVDHRPDQLKMPFVLWTAAAVRDLISQRHGITLSLRSMRRYLDRWNFTPQKPLKKAWAQNPVRVQEWLNTRYPVIAADAKARKALIYWVDETGITNKSNAQRGYAPVGKTPVIMQDARHIKCNMISAITNRGDVRFMCYTTTMTQNKFILFLSKLIASNTGPIIVITDNLRVHHGKRVTAWVERQGREKIVLEYIPSYSPELNADEYLNRDLKKNVNAKRTPRNLADLKENIMSFMLSIQKLPQRVRQYFNGRHIQYAAA